MPLLTKMLSSWRADNGVKTSTILQLSATECGIVSLAIIFAYFDVHVEIDTLRELAGTSRDGAKALTLVTLAEQFHFNAAAYRVEIDDIKLLTEPVIAFWKFNHYVVIEGVGASNVFINDPAFGRTTVSLEEFDCSFTGVIIAVAPSEKTVRTRKRSALLPMIKAWVGEYHHELLFIIVCLSLSATVPLLNAKFSSIFVDFILIGRNLNMVPSITLATFFASLIFTIAAISHKRAQFRLATKSSIIKASEIMLHMLRLPLLFYSLRQKSEISAILMRAETVAHNIYKSMTSLLLSGITASLCLILLIKIDGLLVSVLMALTSVLLLISLVFTKLNYVCEQANVSALGKLYGLTLSAVRNIETLKTCGIEATFFNKWHSALCAKVQAQDKTNTIMVLMDVFYQSFNSIAMLATFSIGVISIADGQLSVGSLMAFYALQCYFCAQITAILNASREAQHAFVSHSRINDVLQQKIDLRFNATEVQALTPDSTLLVCKNIDFYYNQSQAPTLTDINLEIRPGQHVAFVGGTGSGKSTLVKILGCLQPPSRGELRLYGRSPSDYPSEQLANMFAYVSQDVTLFSGSIFDNLTMWQAGIPQAIIESALADACLTNLIEARGLHGKVEEGGNNFSGGERQRIDLARALIQGATVLILDEATSSLDVETEAQIISNLKRRHITILFVAHRLSTVKHCDQIYVMERGAIIERGSHAALVSKPSHYLRLLQSEQSN